MDERRAEQLKSESQYFRRMATELRDVAARHLSGWEAERLIRRCDKYDRFAREADEAAAAKNSISTQQAQPDANGGSI